jgi:3-carboxy-cis,cis-muconate cycloisomerase
MSSASAHLFAPLFADPDVFEQMSDRARLQAMLDVEAALADVQAQLGIIPREAAAHIGRAARADLFDLSAIAAETATDGVPTIPLVRHLTKMVQSTNREAARYVHWGATSQDIFDTALVLQLQRVAPVLLAHLDRAAAAAANHARRYAGTVMAGRTWLQQATPVTFGLKAAGWLDAIARQRRAVASAFDDVRVLQFGGASGTLAALAPHGLDVAERLAERLGLAVPDLPWHAHRDRIARLAAALGVTCGVLGKIGRDVALLAQTEVGEAAEGKGGGSSAMPQKQNPVGASVALAAAVRAPGLVATILAAMPQEHERGLGGWQAEWATVPELVVLTAGASRAVAGMLEGMVVHEDRMGENLHATHGLIAAESVATVLAVHVGRAEAHRMVEQAASHVRNHGGTLADALAANPEVTRYLARADIDRHLTPEHYVGAARELVERALRGSKTM